MKTAEPIKIQRPKKRNPRNRILKFVRRAHMYTGLLLLPWVMLFGISGVLFNHPEWFGPVKVLSQISHRELAEKYSVALPDAEKIADEVLAKINALDESKRFIRPRGGSAVIEGAIMYEARTPSGPASAVISPNGHGASVKRPAPTADGSREKPDFHGARFEVAEYNATAFETAAQNLFKSAGIEGVAPVEANPRGAAEVRFQIETPDTGKRWNVIYGLVTGEVAARAADAPSGVTPHTFVTRLHKTHHYPDRIGARWFWTLLADATGFTMVFWGISGAVMWWQIKPSRLIGIAGLVAAGLIAGFVFSGTMANHTFGPPQQRSNLPSSGKAGSKAGPEKAGTKSPAPISPTL